MKIITDLKNHRDFLEVNRKLEIRGAYKAIDKKAIEKSRKYLFELYDSNTEFVSKFIPIIQHYSNSFQTDFEKVKRELFEDSFLKGFESFIKILIRSKNLQQEEDSLQKNIKMFSIDFFLSLRSSMRADFSKGQAFITARLTYRLPPYYFQHLQKQFPGVDAYAIRLAALGYPTNPTGFIEKYLEQLEVLQKQFPDVDASAI